MAGTYVFDVDAARKAGHSDAEIADFLGRQGGFDTDGARKAGYTDAEIVQQLADKPMAEGGFITTTPAPAAPAAPAEKPSATQDVTGFMANLNRGLGVGDEMAAGAKTAADVVTGKAGIGDIPADFSVNMGHQRQLEAGFAADHPHVAALARGTGNALTMAVPAGPGAEALAAPVVVMGRQVPQVVANALRGADVAGLAGAGYATLDAGTPQERAGAAARAAGNPVTLALGAGAGALATPRAAPAEATAVPTLEELTAAKNAAYKAVDDSGIRFTPAAMQGLLGDINTAMADARFNPRLHTRAAPILDQIADDANRATGYSPTLTELDQLRRQVRDSVAASPDADERRIGKVILGRIDGFISTAGPDQVVGGDPSTAGALIAQARDLNARVEKLRSLDNLDDAAARRAARTGSGGNKENALRQNVDRFLENTGNLTPDEDAAARQTVMGTRVGNVLRDVGKLSPFGNGLGLAIHTVGGITSHGASLPVAAAGAISKLASEAITRRNVQALRELIASGGQAAQEVTRQLADPQYADLRAQLANDLAVQAGVQGSAAQGQAPVAHVANR